MGDLHRRDCASFAGAGRALASGDKRFPPEHEPGAYSLTVVGAEARFGEGSPPMLAARARGAVGFGEEVAVGEQDCGEGGEATDPSRT